MPKPHLQPEPSVLICRQLHGEALQELAAKYSVTVHYGAPDAAIRGTYWGDSEAGLVGNGLHVRADTPVHSALHELCHYVCMSAQRRAGLDTDAGGDYSEENAVCILQILLADYLPPMTRARMMTDMDRWGYTFRLGTAARWFADDADDAFQWLLHRRLITPERLPSWRIRKDTA